MNEQNSLPDHDEPAQLDAQVQRSISTRIAPSRRQAPSAALPPPRADQNRLLTPADKKSRGGVLPATRDPALKSSWTSRPMT